MQMFYLFDNFSLIFIGFEYRLGLRHLLAQRKKMKLVNLKVKLVGILESKKWILNKLA